MIHKTIISPMALGNGAYIVHKMLEENLHGYRCTTYNPKWTMIPFLLKFAAPFGNADIIHTPPDYAFFFNRKSAPLILTFHNYVLDRWMKQHSSFLQKTHYSLDLRLWTLLGVKRAHTITAVSNFTAELVKKDLKLTKPVKVIYNGIDTEHFIPASNKKDLNSDIRVLFSGNLTRRKGAQWLLPIANKLNKNIRIYYTEGLRKGRFFSHNPMLKSVGSVPYNEMPDQYNKTDILLMPTVREGFGLSVAEAMSCGLPIVASDCSAIPELVDEGKGGFLCPVGDVDAFAEKINILADSPELRYEMGEYNRAKAEEKFTLNRMVKEYKDLFDTILS